MKRARPEPGNALAPGAIIEIGISIIAGKVEIGHEVTIVSDGISRVVTIYGATDAELADDDFIRRSCSMTGIIG